MGDYTHYQIDFIIIYALISKKESCLCNVLLEKLNKV